MRRTPIEKLMSRLRRVFVVAATILVLSGADSTGFDKKVKGGDSRKKIECGGERAGLVDERLTKAL